MNSRSPHTIKNEWWISERDSDLKDEEFFLHQSIYIYIKYLRIITSVICNKHAGGEV